MKINDAIKEIRDRVARLQNKGGMTPQEMLFEATKWIIFSAYAKNDKDTNDCALHAAAALVCYAIVPTE